MIKDLSKNELLNLECHLRVVNGLKKYRVKMNFFAIMMKAWPKEFSIRKDKEFFDKYKGKEVYAYGYNGAGHGDDWFILEDNNYCLLKECFEEI